MTATRPRRTRAPRALTNPDLPASPRRVRSGPSRFVRILARDKFALAAASFLSFVLVLAVVGPMLIGDSAIEQHLDKTETPPFHPSNGWMFILGSDSLGRSIVARMIAGCRTDMSIVVPCVIISVTVGMGVGAFAGYWGGWRENLVMRIADVILSFPNLLLAAIVLYVFTPSISSLIVVLAIARLPLFLRTARAQVKEIRSRLFVDAARTFGTPDRKIVRRHIAPLVLPTTLTLAALDFSFVIIGAAALSYLGLGVQPPSVSWGLMVASGQDNLTIAWWEAVWPGMAIAFSALSAAILGAWLRVFADPIARTRMNQVDLA